MVGARATHANEPPFTGCSDCGHTRVQSSLCQLKAEIRDIVRFGSGMFLSFMAVCSHFVPQFYDLSVGPG